MRLTARGRLAAVATSGMAALALATAGALTAHARVTLSAAPVFETTHSYDPNAFHVVVVGDGRDRHVEVVAHARTGMVASQTVLALDLSPGGRKEAWVARLHHGTASTTIEVREGGELLASVALRDRRAPQHVDLIGVLGATPASLHAMSQLDVAPVLDEFPPGWLPPDTVSWPALRALVWLDAHSTDLTPAQAHALARWVWDGGHLVVSPSPDEPDALRHAGLGDLCPVTAAGARQGQALEESLAPWLRSRHGWGMVTFVLTRPDGDPGVSGAGAPPWSKGAWLAALAGAPLAGLPPVRHFTGPTLLGLVDLSGTLLTPPLRDGSLLLALFVLVMSPLEWTLMRRAAARGRRSRGAGLRLAGAVIAFTTAALALTAGARDAGLRARRIDLIDAEAGSDEATGLTVLALRQGNLGQATMAATPEVRWEWLATEDPSNSSTTTPPVSFLQDGADRPGCGTARARLVAWVPARAMARWEPAPEAVPRLTVLRDGRVQPPEGCLGVRLARGEETADPERGAESLGAYRLAQAPAASHRVSRVLDAACGALLRTDPWPHDRVFLVAVMPGTRGPRFVVEGAKLLPSEDWLTVIVWLLPPTPEETAP